MKGFNIRKLATIAAGAALVGSAVAPIAAAAFSDLTKADVVDATGVPVVDIVVGAKAAVSDVVWAGNIAAKLAQLATKPASVTGGGAGATVDIANVKVSVAVGGTTTVTGGKTFFSDMNSATGSTETNFSDQNVTQSNVPSLKYYGSRNYIWGNSSYSTTMQEKMNFTVDTKYDSVSSKALIAEISQKGLKYIVDLGSGVPAVEAAGSATAFADDKNDNVLVPFFGKDYLVKAVTPTGSSKMVELVETNGDKDYTNGDKIENVTDYNGNIYYIKVGAGGVDGTTNKVKLDVYDSTDTRLDGGYYSTGDVTFLKNGQTFLQTSINISAILKASVAQSDVYTATIYVGTARIQLYDGKGYPYDASKNLSEYDYTVTLSFSSDSNYLTRIQVANDQKKNSLTMKVGEKVDYPNGIGSLKAVGLQLPGTGATKTERTTSIVLGGNSLKYKDSTYEAEHTVPFFKLIEGLSSTAADSPASTVISVDGKDISVAANLQDLNIWASGAATGGRNALQTQCIGDQNYINGQMVQMPKATLVAGTSAKINGTVVNIGNRADINGMQFKVNTVTADCAYLTADGNLTIRKDSTTGTLVQEMYYVDNNAAHGGKVALAGASDVTHNFVPMVDETTTNSKANIWLFLGNNTITTQYSKHVKLVSTDTAEDGTAAVPFYLPNSPKLATDYNGSGSYDSTKYHIARFEVDEDEDSTSDYNAFVDADASSGNMITLPNTQLSYYTYEVGYFPAWVSNASYPSWRLSESTTNVYPKDAYADFGTHASLASHVASWIIPENRPQFEMLVSGTGTTTTTTGGETLELAKGATGTTAAGTTIEIKDVTGATCSAGAGSCSPESYEMIVPVSKLVYTDDNPPAGKVIIVGGHLVNALAQSITDDVLVAAGDKVAEKKSNGDIVVAGYTAADTGAAAQELIDALDALMQ